MPALPRGTVTFLFSDIERSTRLLQRLGDRYADVLAEYRRLLRETFETWDGHEIDTAGDGFFVAFQRATHAAAAAVVTQRALAVHPWPESLPVHVRMGLHTGEPTLTASGYVGLDVHRAARICAAGHGRQTLLSQTTRALVEHDLPAGVSLRDLGEHALRTSNAPNACTRSSSQTYQPTSRPLRPWTVAPTTCPCSPPRSSGGSGQAPQPVHSCGVRRCVY
jgi:class 3 adenylate cyclase